MKTTFSLLVLLAMVPSIAVQGTATNATVDVDAETLAVAASAPFANQIGIQCTTRSDCGTLPSLACVYGVCEYCRVDDDCATAGKAPRKCVIVKDKDSKEIVGLNSHGQPTTAAYCIEKNLFGPFTWNDLLTTILTILATALGSGGGVGGGGLLVPAFILVSGMDAKHAIPCSKASIFGNAVAIYLITYKDKHPKRKNMPIIDYRLASIMEPSTLIGAVFGVMMNIVFPEWLVLVLLMTLLSYITYTTYKKGMKLRAKETAHNESAVRKVLTGRSGRSWSIYKGSDWEAAARKWLDVTRRNKKLRTKQQADEADFASLPPLKSHMRLPTTESDKHSELQLQNKADFGTFSTNNEDTFGDDSATILMREQIERRDAVIFPMRYILPLVLCWLIVLFQALLRGGHGAPSLVGITCDSGSYWALTLIPVLLLVIVAWRIGYHLRLDNRLRVLSNYHFLDSDIHWTRRNVTMYPIICTTAGVAAGMLGIGGGMVKGPIMLAMGVLPPIQSATASYMILYTASSTTLQFAIAGMFPGELQYDYVLWFILCGFVGAMLGMHVVRYLLRKYKRESILVFILSITIGLSAVAMGYVGVRSVIRDVQKHAHLGFEPLCGHE